MMHRFCLFALSFFLLVAFANAYCCPYSLVQTAGAGVRHYGNLTTIANLRTGLSGLPPPFGAMASSADACTTWDVCGDNSTCLDVSTNIVNCTCHTGYEEQGNSSHFSCADIDECAAVNASSLCHGNATCQNTDGSYKCDCNPGFVGDGVTNCTELNECSSNPCTGSFTTCIDEINNYTCVCSNGFAGAAGGVNCSDIDECSTGSPCDSNANCTNTIGSFMCSCNPYFTGDGINCTDLDECAHGLDNCTNPNATCVNLPSGSGFTCECNSSFTGDGHTCTEIDSCLSNPCDSNANCTDRTFGYDCTCNSGFSGDGFTCSNINDCTNTSCAANATCTDLVNSFSCACDSGFSGNAMTNCSDIDECPGACGTNAQCNNTIGSFVCSCDTANGFIGNPYVRCENRKNESVSFSIVCDSYAFVSQLTNTTSAEYMALTGPILTEITTAIHGQDSDARITCNNLYSNDSTSVNSTIATVDCLVANTTLSSDDLNDALNGLDVSTVCGGRASVDECSQNLHNCGSATCQDTVYGFCCFSDFEMVLETRLYLPFEQDFTNRSSSRFNDLETAMLQYAKQGAEAVSQRGCEPHVDIETLDNQNGSTISVYRLTIVNSTASADDITASLSTLAANVLTTILGSNIIATKDYDECLNDYLNLRNCSQFATCINSNGTYRCDCNSTHYDTSNTTGLASGFTCINPVIVSCNDTAMTASVLSDYYINHGINLNHLHLNDLNCTRATHSVTKGDTTEFSFLNTDCGTNVTDNGTHVYLENTIGHAWPLIPFTGLLIDVPVRCVYLKNANVSFNLSGTFDVVPFPATESIGEFLVRYALYTDITFSSPAVAGTVYSSTDTLYTRIYIVNNVGPASVRVNDCWGTPYPLGSPLPNPSATFINGTCSTNDVVEVTIIQNGNSDALFHHPVFFFPVTQNLYLHCDVTICQGVCTGMPTCPSKRRRRDAEDETVEALSEEEPSGTITIVIQHDPNDDSVSLNDVTHLIHTNNVTITIVACILGLVLIILLAVIVVFVCRKNRERKEEYNLDHVNMHAIDKAPAYRV